MQDISSRLRETVKAHQSQRKPFKETVSTAEVEGLVKRQVAEQLDTLYEDRMLAVESGLKR